MAPAAPAPLVLLSGMGCTARLWDDVVPRLGPVLRLDPTGEDLDAAVAAVLDVAPPRFALAGLSLGGILAMAVVRAAPERVERLALLSTNPRPPTPEQRAGWSATAARLAAGLPATDLQRELLPVLLHPGARAAHDETVVAMAAGLGAQRYLQQLRLQGTRVDERPGLARVAVPTLVLAPAADRLCPLARHEEIADAVPGARLEVLPATGHLAPLERPDAVAAHLSTWLTA